MKENEPFSRWESSISMEFLALGLNSCQEHLKELGFQSAQCNTAPGWPQHIAESA